MTDGSARRSETGGRVLLVGTEDRLAPARTTLEAHIGDVTVVTRRDVTVASTSRDGPPQSTDDALAGRLAADCVVFDAVSGTQDPASAVDALATTFEETPMYVVVDEGSGFDAVAALDAGATDVVREDLLDRAVFATRVRGALDDGSGPQSADRGRRGRASAADEAAPDGGSVDGAEPSNPDRQPPSAAVDEPALVDMVDRTRAVERELVEAESREAVEQAVCDRLTSMTDISFAWFGEADSQFGTVSPRAWSGDSEYLGRVSVDATAGDADDPPAARTFASGTATTLGSLVGHDGGLDAASEWRAVALECGHRSALSLPVAHDGVYHGVLTVFGAVQNAFDGATGPVVRELASTAAYALDMLEEREASRTTPELVLECLATTPQTFLPRTAAAFPGTVELSHLFGTDDVTRAFFDVRTGDPDAFAAFAARDAAVVDATTVPVDDAVYVATRDTVLATVANHRGDVRRFDGRGDAVHFSVGFPTDVDVDRVQSLLDAGGDDVTVLSRRHVDDEGGESAAFAATVKRRLSADEYDALRSAHAGGYYAAPRSMDEGEVSDLLDVEEPEAERRLRVAETRVFDALFDE